MGEHELARLKERGLRIPSSERMLHDHRNQPDRYACPALDRNTGKCKGHEVRPMICRLWGVADPMLCPYGCEMEGEPLSMAEGQYLLDASMHPESHQSMEWWDEWFTPERSAGMRRIFTYTPYASQEGQEALRGSVLSYDPLSTDPVELFPYGPTQPRVRASRKKKRKGGK
jgi:hypothetical protein